VFGDAEGAIDLMQGVYARIAPQDIEERAWHLVQMARPEDNGAAASPPSTT